MERIWVWLSRCRRIRGFGVQSPWAYQFIRYVINERYPYYAYKQFSTLEAVRNPYRKKMGGLYFRLANYRQPDMVWESSSSDSYAEYFRLGCQRAVVMTGDEALPDQFQLVRMSSTEHHAFYESVCQQADERTILVIEGIAKNEGQKRLWEDVQHDERTGVTFDLYYCGIVFFDKSRYKHHYVVNF